jgi:CRISPR/Cas system-associated exonuclease Cas4 (RecB family)
LKALLIHPRHNLIEQILPFLKGRDRDFSSSLVVFPGRRPSHFLRKNLARDIQTSFIPPVVLSMDEFVDFVSKRTQSKRRLETLDAISILYDIHKKTATPLGHNRFLTPDSFFPIGLKLHRDLEELAIEGINPHLVKSMQPYIDEKIPEHTLKRLQSLSYFYEEFYKTIEQHEYTTRALRYRIASDTVDNAGLDAFRIIIFAGFFALTRCEQTIFKKLLSLDNSLFIFQDGTGIEETFQSLGIRVEREDPTPPETEIHFYQSPDTHGQVYALSTIMSSKIQGNDPLDERTTIVLPSSETLFPLLRQGLSTLSDEDFNISLGYPLNRTPIFGFMNNLMELIISMDEDRVYIPDYLKFVLHPYTKNILFNGNAEITRIMFHSIEEKLMKNRTRTFLTLEEIEGDETLITHITHSIPRDMTGITFAHIKNHLHTIHQATIGKFVAFDSIRDFAIKCTDLLTYIYNNSTARLHPLFYPFSESFIRSLDLLSRSLMKTVAFTERSSYFTFFRKYIMTCHTPFEGTPITGIQVLGFLETRALRFDTVFLLDANEDIIPDTKRDDTLLPHKARQILGLPTYQDRDRLTAYYFQTLMKGAREVHLFYCENDKKERSRFVEQLLWEKQKQDGTTDVKKYLNFMQYKVHLEQSLPQDIVKTDSLMRSLKDFTYSATSLDTYLKCPVQFYYSYMLRLDKKYDLSGAIERVDIGKLVHRILAVYFSRRTGTLLKARDLDIHEMEHLIEKHFEQSYGKHVTGTAYLLKRQIEHHLRDFLQLYYIPLVKEESVTILRTEYDIDYRTGPFALKGRLDSIEKRGEKTYIIDYKTGANPLSLKINYKDLNINRRETWSDAIGSLQLPLYILLYSRLTRKSTRHLNGMFLLLGKARISKDIESPLFDHRVDAHKMYHLLEDIIFQILNEITDPSIPFTPTQNKRTHCPSCDFHYMCGTQWIMKR